MRRNCNSLILAIVIANLVLAMLVLYNKHSAYYQGFDLVSLQAIAGLFFTTAFTVGGVLIWLLADDNELEEGVRSVAGLFHRNK